MKEYEDLTGQKFGRFTALYHCDWSMIGGWWHCRCDCGTEIDIPGYQLRSGKRTRCKKCAGRDKANGIQSKMG